MKKRTVGIFFIVLSLLVWLTDRLTHAISTMLGKIIYGDQYMQSVDGIVGDSSCGFNIDMYLAYSLFTVFLLGILLYFSSMKERVQMEENIKNTL